MPLVSFATAFYNGQLDAKVSGFGYSVETANSYTGQRTASTFGCCATSAIATEKSAEVLSATRTFSSFDTNLCTDGLGGYTSDKKSITSIRLYINGSQADDF
ncbi:MAG: hypothetical protein KGQ36_02845 [Rickettsiales bacterium]|nr:hypothetical protein [Rickettsiales bacterium]